MSNSGGGSTFKSIKDNLNHHKNQIDKIETENRTLLQELSLEKHFSKQATGSTAMKEIERLQKQVSLEQLHSVKLGGFRTDLDPVGSKCNT